MPYVNPPVCFLCRKVHSRDTVDTLQMVAPDGDTVNVCKDHPGVAEEAHRQANLSTEGKQALAMKALAHPRMQAGMKKIFSEIRDREDAFLNRMIEEGRKDEAEAILHGWKKPN